MKRVVSSGQHTGRVVLSVLQGVGRHRAGASHADLARWARTRMTEMGPSFVKLGQMVACRPDVFPNEVVKEFEPLLRDVPSCRLEDLVGADKALISPRVVLEETPLATGSIAQVHRGTLTLRTQPVAVTRDVVVKIKKPGIGNDLRRDISALKTIVGAGLPFVPGLHDLNAFLDQFDLLVTNEVDFVREADNMTAYSSFRNPMMKVPEVYERECGPDCIVMEYCPATSVPEYAAKSSKVARTFSANLLMQLYMHRLLSTGHFHADPHPGNIGILDDGRIVFYDYGAVMRFDSYMRSALRHICACVITGDVDTMVEEMVKRKFIINPDGADKEFAKSDVVKIHGYMRAMLRYIQTTDMQEVGAVVGSMSSGPDNRSPFMFAPKVLLMLRAMAMLEGTCKALDPEFSYTASLAALFFTDAGVRVLEKRVMNDFRLLRGAAGLG